LNDLVPVKDRMAALKEFFTFPQCEGLQFDPMRDPVMQASFVIDQLIDHPGGGRAANDQQYIIPSAGPGVPEMFQSRNK
jgi:hypothetical protein